jgi:hypothetical protein
VINLCEQCCSDDCYCPCHEDYVYVPPTEEEAAEARAAWALRYEAMGPSERLYHDALEELYRHALAPILIYSDFAKGDA